MTIEHIVETYGALGVFIGTFFEGEAIVVLAAFAAHQGYLPLWQVVLAAFAGACLGDQFYFYLGRYHGRDLLARRPAWENRVQKATHLVERFHVWIIPAIRFFYGLRTVLCLAIGMSRVSGWTFAILNTAGVAVWALLTSLGGYYLGRVMQIILADAKKYELATAAVIAAAGVAVWGYRRYRRWREQ
jgi:membrane protein DedA with SNARE-associated domain